MKKIIILVVIVLLGVGGYFLYNNFKKEEIPILDVEEEYAKVNEYYIYGNTLNIIGEVKNINTNYSDVDLVLYSDKGEFLDYDLNVKKNVNNLSFNFTDELNTGMYLDDIPVGKYPIFLRLTYDDEDDKKSYKYYVMDNNTDYDNVIYYTISTYNNMITINSVNDYKTMMFNVTKNNEEEVYDVVIDPGHGGEDGGATVGDVSEKELTLSISNLVKSKLEEAGYKVKLTREENEFTDGEYFEEYNVEGKGYIGRAVRPHEAHAKYVLSLHINSSTASYVHGFEVYIADNIDQTLAELLVNNIKESALVDTSTNSTNRVSPGVYIHNYNESEIQAAKERYDNLGYNHYEVTTKSNYLYIIRETGGYMTGAYVDGRNATVGANPYYNTNVGIETYLIELGYLTNADELNKLQNNQEGYAKGIADSMISELKNELNVKK